jgi:HD-GYP domain-containing protein (c-di-GMP phosphodiesterase class II)
MDDFSETTGTACIDVPRARALPIPAADFAELARENESLADEVLHCYEQINFLFDVSAQIAILNDGAELRRLLLVKLRDLFGAEAVYYLSANHNMLKHVGPDRQVHRTWHQPDHTIAEAARPSPNDELRRAFPDVELPSEFEVAIRRLDATRRTFAFVGDADNATGHATSMWGQLPEDEGIAGTVGLIRRQRPFVSADLLLFDSTLTYAGHVLDNLRLVERLKRTSFEAVRALVNAIDQKDPYTAGHSERVGFLAKITGEHIGLREAEIQHLEWAGLLHDVGKIGIPEGVLNKPGRLSPEEYAVIKGHPARSFEVLRPVAQLGTLLDAVLYHHENPDGTGYPKGLKGDEIPLVARIIHVVDVFDALTSTRSYREAFSVSKAIEILRQDAGKKLDAVIVKEFLDAWALLPKTHPEEYERWFANIRQS